MGLGCRVLHDHVTVRLEADAQRTRTDPDLLLLRLQDPATCSEELLSALVARLQDGRQPAVLRATCAAYAASFLARASFIPDALVVQALQV